MTPCACVKFFQHISALVLLAFVAMIVDVVGVYKAAAHEDAPVSASMGYHGAAPPTEWEHEKPCTSNSIVPCPFCAIPITLSVESAAEEFQVLNDRRPHYFIDSIAEHDPDPPQKNLF